MNNGGWRMEDGGWRMENGGWRMENGGWRMENGELVSFVAECGENPGILVAGGGTLDQV
jgi:hypothetical protein